MEIAKNVLLQLTIPTEFMSQLECTDKTNVTAVILHVIKFLGEADCLKLLQHVSYTVSPGVSHGALAKFVLAPGKDIFQSHDTVRLTRKPATNIHTSTDC